MSDNIIYVLKKLKSKSINKSNLADMILDFWDLDNRFYVNACVYKGMDLQLIEHIKSRDKL